MPYSTVLADRVRNYLATLSHLKVEEKEMFGGLAFLVNDKMCVNVSEEKLMCRYDPEYEHLVADRPGFEPMIMKGKKLRGYCLVGENGYNNSSDFEYWFGICLDFNDKAKSSKR